MLHACTIEDKAFIGMSSLIMDLAIIETEAMVAAGTVITPGKIVKRGEIWSGNPGKLMRKMSEEEIKFITTSAKNYILLAQEYFS